jgi:hypothetical protein
MPFKKGISGNPGGKPIGSSNQQRVLLEKMRKIALDNIKQIEQDLKQCEPRDRIRFIIQILTMVVPKPLNEKEITELEVKPEKNINLRIADLMFENLTPDEMNQKILDF